MFTQTIPPGFEAVREARREKRFLTAHLHHVDNLVMKMQSNSSVTADTNCQMELGDRKTYLSAVILQLF